MIFLNLDDTAVTVLLEDFKARWQELLNTGAEVSSWSTVYYTALVLTVGWVLGRRSKEGLRDLFNRERPAETFLVISLAMINAVYILGIAVKSYHIQQIALYLYEVVDKRITILSGEPFNSWEAWRRTRFQMPGNIGRPEDARTIYYFLMLLLPVGVSASILGLYLRYDKPWKDYWWLRFSNKAGSKADERLRAPSHLLNSYFGIVAIINLLAIALTIYLAISMNSMWEADIKQHTNSALNVPTISNTDQVVSRDALKTLWKIDAATQVGIDKAAYTSLLIDAKSEVNESLGELKNEQIKSEIKLAVTAYLDALQAWNLNQEPNNYVNTDTPEMQEWLKKYSITPDDADAKRIRRETLLRAIWLAARRHLDRASTFLATQPTN